MNAVTETLTANETAALKACLNYGDRESQLADNYSVAGAAEIAEAIGSSRKAAGGVQSSLIQKGLAYIDEDDVDVLWLTEQGVNAIFDVIEGVVDGRTKTKTKEKKVAAVKKAPAKKPVKKAKKKAPARKAPAKPKAATPANYPPNDRNRRDVTWEDGKCQRCLADVPVAEQFSAYKKDGVIKKRKAIAGKSHYCGECIDGRVKEANRLPSPAAKDYRVIMERNRKAYEDAGKPVPAELDVDIDAEIKAAAKGKAAPARKAAPKAKAPARKVAKPAAKKKAPARKAPAKPKAAPKKVEKVAATEPF